MIIECPQCRAAHSKSDQELASAAAIVCRRCGTPFDAKGEKVAAAKIASAPSVAAGGKSAAAPSSTLPELALELGSGPESITAAAGASRHDPLGIDDLDLGLERAAAPKAEAKPASPAIDDLELDLGVPSNGPLADVGSAGGLSLDFGPDGGQTPAAKPLAPVPTPASARPGVDGAARPSADATETRARATGSGSGWSDTPTDVIKPTALPKRLEQQRADDEVPRAPPQAISGARGNVFPKEAWSRFATELGRYLRAAPSGVKLAVGAMTLVPVLFVVIAARALVGGDRAVAYVAERQPLLAGPLAGEAYEHLAPVERASRVEVYEGAGELALVRDSLGRVGYVHARSLREEPPPAIPSQPFADCARAPFEASIERCQTRAQQQFDSCRELCASSSDEPPCLEHCQRRFADCNTTCEQLEPPPARSHGVSGPRVAPEAPAAAPAPPELPRKRAKSRTKKKKAR